MPGRGLGLCSMHLHEHRWWLPELFLLRCLRCPWGTDCGADSAGSLAGLHHYDSISNSHSGPLLKTWVHFTWGNGLFCFLSKYKVGVPSFGCFNKVSSKTVNPAVEGWGRPCQRATHWHLKLLQMLTFPSTSRRQLKICISVFLYIVLHCIYLCYL